MLQLACSLVMSFDEKSPELMGTQQIRAAPACKNICKQYAVVVCSESAYNANKTFTCAHRTAVASDTL